jgi:DNA-binding NtrC family response regulator
VGCCRRRQAKFLKVLEDGRFAGSTQSEPADVAIVAATSEDLLDAVRGRRPVRIHHRLAVVTVRLPPSGARSDILLLAEHLLARAWC